MKWVEPQGRAKAKHDGQMMYVEELQANDYGHSRICVHCRKAVNGVHQFANHMANKHGYVVGVKCKF